MLTFMYKIYTYILSNRPNSSPAGGASLLLALANSLEHVEHRQPSGPRLCGVKFSHMPCTLSSGMVAWPRVVPRRASPFLFQVAAVAIMLVRPGINKARSWCSLSLSSWRRAWPAKEVLLSSFPLRAVPLILSTSSRTFGMCLARMILRSRFTCGTCSTN